MARSQDELRPGATACVNSFARIGNDDHVLILSDNVNIAEALVRAIRSNEQSMEATVDVVYLMRLGQPARGVSTVLEAARGAATVIFNVLTEYDTQHEFFAQEHDFRRQIVSVDPKCKLRIFHMLGVDEFAFTPNGLLAQSAAEIDEMEELTHHLAIALTLARTVRVYSGADAELTISAGGPGNVSLVSSGRLLPGTWGNLPSGEAFLLPRAANGSLVVDKAVAGVPAGFGPFRLNAQDGRVSIGADAPRELREILQRDEEKARAVGEVPENVRRICEFGIGTNPRAKVSSSFIEIEKILGTIHVAVGGNTAFGGDVRAPGHTDMVVGAPKVVLDDRHTILADGKLQREALMDFMRPTSGTIEPAHRGEKTVVERLVNGVREKDGKLYRYWIDPRKNELSASIGEDETARMAAVLWGCFGDQKSREIGQLAKQFVNRIANSSLGDVLRLLTVLERFGAVSFRDPARGPRGGI